MKTERLILIKTLTSLSFLLFISVLTAQERSKTLLDKLSVRQVVISGSKRKTDKKEISQTIDVVSSEDLKFNSASNTGDALENTGMITVQKSQNGGGSPILRGFEANRIGIVVDGVRMNTAIFRGGHLQNVMRVDNGQLDRLEVFYGAGSTLYGSDALGGVLNFITTKPKLKTGLNGNGLLRYSSANDEKTVGFTINYGTKKFASLTSLTYTSFGNLRMGANREPQYGNWGKRIYIQGRINNRDTMILNSNPNIQVNSSYQQYNILQKILYRPNTSTNHLINIQYSNSSDIPRYDRLTEKVDNSIIDANPQTNQFRHAEWYYGPEARLMIAYRCNQYLNYKFIDNYNLTVAYQNYKESRNTRIFGSTEFRSRQENVDIGSINFDLYKKLNNHKFTYGLELINNWVASSVNQFDITTGASSYASTRYPDGGSRTESYAIYLQDIWEVTKDLAYFNLGGRYSYHTIHSIVNDTNRRYGSFDITNHAYSINAGLSFIPTKKNKLSLNFSSGFRTPNLDDVSKVFDNTNWIQVNDPNLSPELAFNYEVSSSNWIGDMFNFEVGAYYTSIKDYIINEPTTVNGNSFEVIDGRTYFYQRLGNSKSARILGLYGGLKLQIRKNLSLNGNINYTQGYISNSLSAVRLPLEHIPPFSGRIALRYELAKASFEFSTLFNGEKSSEDYSMSGEDNIDKSADPINGHTPAWYTLNVRTSYSFGKLIIARLSFENLLDKHYRVFASGISSMGRNLRMSIQFNY